MKSVYVDDALHKKLKQLAQENEQSLISLLNQLVQEGIERMEKHRYHPPSPTPDPVGMFGITSRRAEEIETAYGSDRYQGVGEADDRF